MARGVGLGCDRCTSDRLFFPQTHLIELTGEGSKEKYDEVVREVAPTGHVPGQLVHVAGAVEGGWRVLDVSQTQETFNVFLQEKLGAAMQRHQVPEPELTAFPVYNLEEVQV